MGIRIASPKAIPLNKTTPPTGDIGTISSPHLPPSKKEKRAAKENLSFVTPTRQEIMDFALLTMLLSFSYDNTVCALPISTQRMSAISSSCGV